LIDLKAHLKTLSELNAPSGYESPVREALEAVWKPLIDQVSIGKLGDLIARKRGTGSGKTIMLCAHMDEIGLMVRRVEKLHGSAFLRVARLGGIDVRVYPGNAVTIHGRQTVRGVVGIHPLSMFSTPPSEFPKLDELWIDPCLSAREVDEWVQVGDIVTLDVPFTELKGKRVMGKAIDDRACIAAITHCLDLLQSRRHVWDVLAVASTQEEVGGHGASTSASTLNPDLAIALDVTFATQPGVAQGAFKLGSGIPISLGANFHPVLYKAIRKTAETLELTTHADPLPGPSGTDGWPIQVAQEGIPTALINLQIRNMHTPAEIVDLHDIERVGRLLAEFIARLPEDFLETLKWDTEQDA
jgi:endoglucanase